MAEALAAVGAVASIVQLIDFGARVLSRLNDFQSTTRKIPEAYRQVKSELPLLIHTLNNTKTAIDAGAIPDETTKALGPVLEDCLNQIKSFDSLIEKVLPLPSDSWSEKSRKAFSSLRLDSKINKIRMDLRVSIQNLTYHHAASSSSSSTPQGKSH
jgi:hypothetical protein